MLDGRSFVYFHSPSCQNHPLTLILAVDVSVVSDEISKFTETGLITANGQSYDFDIIACCTGFDVAFAPHLLVCLARYIFKKKKISLETKKAMLMKIQQGDRC